MASKVSIEINAIDKASGIIQAIVGGITNGANAFDLISAAAAVAASVVRESIEAFAKYSEQVKDFSRIAGVTSEEASRLIQIADDVRISFEALTTAARHAAKDGISLTVEEIKKLSEEYLALQPGAERANFLIETFGRSGLEMGKLLEKGAQGIDELNDGISENLILTKRAIADAESYKRNVDSLNDSWEGFKMVLGQEVVPALNEVLIGFNNTNAIRERANQLIEEGTAKNREQALSLAAAEVQQAELNKSMLDGEGATNAYNSALGIATASLQDFQIASQEVSKENTTFLSLIQSVGKETENYTAKQDDLIAKLSQLRDEQSKYAAGGAKYKEVQSEIDAVTAKMEENAAAHSAATNTILFNLLQQRLAIGGLSDAESEFLIQQGVNLGIFDEQTATMAQSYMDTAAQLEQSFINTNTIGTDSFNSMAISMGASLVSIDTAAVTTAESLSDNFGGVGIEIANKIDNEWVPEIEQALIRLKETFKANFDDMIDASKRVLEERAGEIKQAVSNLIELAKGAIEPLTITLSTPNFDEITSRVEEGLDNIMEIGEKTIKPFILTVVQPLWEFLKEKVEEGATKIYEAGKKALKSISVIVGLPDWDRLVSEIEEGMAMINAALKGGSAGVKKVKGSQNFGARAMGGRIDAGTPTLVGERGAEIFVPDTGGRIIPNYKLGASSGGNIIVNLTYAPAFSTVDQYELQERLSPFIERGIRNVQRGTA